MHDMIFIKMFSEIQEITEADLIFLCRSPQYKSVVTHSHSLTQGFFQLVPIFNALRYVLIQDKDA